MRVLKARFRDKQEFLEAYDGELPHGGLFCATTTALAPEESVLVEINFSELPNKMILRGTVVSWRPALPRLRVRAGAVVAFAEDEGEKRDFLLDVAAGRRPGAVKRKHTRLPVEMPVRWRTASSTDLQDALLRDISIGGAQLITHDAIDIDEDIVLEITAPGGARPVPIAGKISNATASGYGVRFIYRDGGGSRRLREVVRRLVSGE